MVDLGLLIEKNSFMGRRVTQRNKGRLREKAEKSSWEKLGESGSS